MKTVLPALAALLLAASPAAASEVAVAWYDNDQGAHEEAAYQIVALSPVRPHHLHTIVSCTNTSGCAEYLHPAFSPDGKEVVFAEIPDVTGGGPTQSHLMLAGTDGSPPHALLTGAADARQPSFMPDGRHVLFVAGPGGNLVISTPDGSSQIALPVTGSDPVASPNGHWILYEHAGGIWETTVKGTRVTRLLVPNAAEPAVAPNGRSLVYVAGKARILTVSRRDGSHAHPVLQRRAHGKPTRIVSVDFPVFSPDGRQVAFGDSDFSQTGDQVGNPYLYAVPASGGRLSTLWSTSTDSGGTMLGTAWGR